MEGGRDAPRKWEKGMTSVASGSESLFFHRKGDIVDHLLAKVLANGQRKIGTEWEMFLIRPEFFIDPDFSRSADKKAFSSADRMRVFKELMYLFKAHGHAPEYMWEGALDVRHIVGVSVPGLVTVVPEAGHQFEFSCSVCDSVEEVAEKNEEIYRTIMAVADHLGYVAVFKGHVPGYAETADVMSRSRALEWMRYYESARFSERERFILSETQNGTASVQFTVDAGGEDFHEFFRALLLIEPALTAYYANSDRSFVGIRSYGAIVPSQVAPIVDAWTAKTPRQALDAIVERLMRIDVPFLPDPEHEGLYKAEPFRGSRPPCVQEIMDEGRLNERMLNNICGFFYTRPALKNFAQGLLEVRGVDSQSEPETIADIARRICALLYRDEARKQLLRDYDHLTSLDIQRLHKASVSVGKGIASQLRISGMTFASFVADILYRSEAPRSFAKIIPFYGAPLLAGRKDNSGFSLKRYNRV